MFEGLNMGDLGKMLQEVQEKAKSMEEQSSHVEFSVKSGGGLVKITANGKGEIIDVEIDDSLLEDKEAMQILLISAMNDTVKMIEDHKKQAALSVMGGLGAFGPKNTNG